MSKKPVLRSYPVPGGPKGTPQMTELHYDVWSLRITLDFDDWDGVVYLDFEAPIGFRVLDEGDLSDFWTGEGLTKHWLHAVKSGGWLSQEAERKGFAQDVSEMSEYLVRGTSDCVSVLSVDEPVITVLGEES